MFKPHPTGHKVHALIITGPTASGKTAAALAIAQRWPAEIISVDSALVYRGMDIGTAKPSAAEQASTPHHLIDIRDPLEAYSAAEFVADAQRLIADINARGRIALLVGGTMLYLKALQGGLFSAASDMPKASPRVRADIAAQAALVGWPALHAELARIDPLTAARLAVQDSQRIARALEVFRLSGQPLSVFHAQDASKKIAAQAYKTPATDDIDNILMIPMISLEPLDRSWLHARIAQRFDAMLASGFLDEVARLRARGDLHADLPAMRCVGYRQAWEAMAGQSPMAELRDKGVFATRQLAKRQITWLRSMPERHIVACDEPSALLRVLAKVETLLNP